MNFLLRTLFFLSLFWGSTGPAWSQATILEKAEQFALEQVRGIPGQAQAKAAALDPRLQLAPCQTLEAFSPAGSRPLGSTTVGIRCLSPAHWSILVPVKVSVMGTYVASSRQIAQNTPLQTQDLILLSGDLASLPNGTVTTLGDALGKTLKFGLAAGQPLRRDLLLSPFLIQQGQDVKLRIVGKGFTISTDAKAMGNAAEGQLVQVKTANGSQISGTAKADGSVEAKN